MPLSSPSASSAGAQPWVIASQKKVVTDVPLRMNRGVESYSRAPPGSKRDRASKSWSHKVYLPASAAQEGATINRTERGGIPRFARGSGRSEEGPRRRPAGRAGGRH